MVEILTQKDLRAVRDLPFCYDCAGEFALDDKTNHDHVPASALFPPVDRVPLKLKTHLACNHANHLEDQKFGQLLDLRRGKAPSDPRDQHLRIALLPREGLAAVDNLAIKQQVWRWIRGFHAALYRQPLPRGTRAAVETPFPSARIEGDKAIYEHLKPQHGNIVKVIKENRFARNLDRIRCNNEKLLYECVWVQADNDGPWMCFFALDIDGWKDLGDKTLFRQRGCAGFYTLASGQVPTNATKGTKLSVIIPNLDPLDPFAA